MIGQSFTDCYEEHRIYIKVDLIKEKKAFILTSKSASSQDIKNYVKKVTSIRYKKQNLITIYRPLIHGKKKEERTIDWESVEVQTNKNCNNTIYSSNIKSELFDDLHRFINSEELYAERGIPYNRGYFLNGPPGCGKTSCAKIIANIYGLPIFCLDLTIIDENSTLIKLMTEINYYTNNEKYLLLIEDADKSDFFQEEYRRQTKVTMDCLLNCIDGVLEPHGRILIITTNYPNNITKHKALMRPGRIDKSLEVGLCTDEQIKQMYELFYKYDQYKVNWDNWVLSTKLSPAYAMKLLQENNNPEIFIQLIAESKINDQKIDNNSTLQTAIETVKKEISKSSKNEDEDEDENNGRRYRRYRRTSRYKENTKKDINAKIRRIKRSITRTTKRANGYKSSIEKMQNKLPTLLEKLNIKKEKERIKKLKEKAIKLAKYKDRVQNENIEEEEYETPAFLMNSIEVDEIPQDTITTYETIEENYIEHVKKLFDENQSRDDNLLNNVSVSVNGNDVDSNVDSNVDDWWFMLNGAGYARVEKSSAEFCKIEKHKIVCRGIVKSERSKVDSNVDLGRFVTNGTR
jgi:SpoVK/Ycf46/Vps4 family AAA+-type ATPase